MVSTTTYWVGYDKMLESLRKRLDLKIISLYVIDDLKKEEFKSLIRQIDDMVSLLELEKKIDEALKEVWHVTALLLEKADSKIITEFKMAIQKEIVDSIKKKEEWDVDIDLDILDQSLDKLLEKI